MITASPIRSGCIVARRGPLGVSSDPLRGWQLLLEEHQSYIEVNGLMVGDEFLHHTLAQTGDRDTVGELIEGDDVAHCIAADPLALGQSRKPV
jgi:hypothetical protein